MSEAKNLKLDRVAKSRSPTTLLRQIQSRIAGGASVKEACGEVSVSVPTYYRWRSESGGKKPPNPSSDTFRMIMDAATKLFLSEGSAVSIDRVAVMAGLSRQTVFNNIGSKENLFRQVVSAIQLRLLGSLPGLRANDDLRDGLLAFATQYCIVAYDPEGIALYKLLISESRAFPDLARFASTLGAARAAPLLSAFFAEKIAQGSLRSIDPNLTAESFLSAVIGRARWAVLLGNPMEPESRRIERLRNTVDIFVSGLTIDQ